MTRTVEIYFKGSSTLFCFRFCDRLRPLWIASSSCFAGNIYSGKPRGNSLSLEKIPQKLGFLFLKTTVHQAAESARSVQKLNISAPVSSALLFLLDFSRFVAFFEIYSARTTNYTIPPFRSLAGSFVPGTIALLPPFVPEQSPAGDALKTSRLLEKFFNLFALNCATSRGNR